MTVLAQFRTEGQRGLVRAIAARLLALLLVIAVFVPTLLHAGGEPPSMPPSHVMASAATTNAPSSNHDRCGCIESLCHGLYRHAEVDRLPGAAQRAGQRLAYTFADEAASSMNPSPLPEPPRA